MPREDHFTGKNAIAGNPKSVALPGNRKVGTPPTPKGTSAVKPSRQRRISAPRKAKRAY